MGKIISVAFGILSLVSLSDYYVFHFFLCSIRTEYLFEIFFSNFLFCVKTHTLTIYVYAIHKHFVSAYSLYKQWFHSTILTKYATLAIAYLYEQWLLFYNIHLLICFPLEKGKTRNT